MLSKILAALAAAGAFISMFFFAKLKAKEAEIADEHEEIANVARIANKAVANEINDGAKKQAEVISEDVDIVNRNILS